jgi:NAD(P)-dependent dehydrogenase (short-subunit alcohol dehydrogenase family)
MAKARLRPVGEQVIVITGGTSGIGLATARMAVRRGARLVLVARDAEALADVRSQIGHETEVETVVADVGVEAEVDRAAELAAARFGGFDTWVNNAGVSAYARTTELPVADQKRIFDTNLWGVVHGSRAAARHLAGRGGAIINVGSVLSDRAIPMQGPYSASKHAVMGWTDAFRMELEHDGAPISVTLIKPSAIDTPYTEHALNMMPNRPVNPPPVYAPELVAEAILHAAETPVRALYVGGGGWAISLFGRMFPRVTDKVMSLALVEGQQVPGQPEPPNRPDSLHAPRAGDGHERGPYKGPVRKTSLLLQAQMHPLASLALLGAGVAAVASSALRPRRRSRWPRV